MTRSSKRAPKILVVDDDPGLLRLLTIRLRSQKYEVEPAESATKALTVIARFRPDLNSARCKLGLRIAPQAFIQFGQEDRVWMNQDDSEFFFPERGIIFERLAQEIVQRADGFHTRESAAAGILVGRLDAIAFGRPFIANPDLPKRFRLGAQLNSLDDTTLYGAGAKGYTDYPVLAA